ncbi:MAG TPA: AMP-binding protein [Thermoanaerobaculia bacterium]|jgi:amino acid adenylation domain-containing protein
MLVHHFLERSADRLPDKEALVCGARRLTYSEVEERANRLANALLSYGLRPGDRAAVWLESGVEAVVAIFAILKAGGVFLPLNPQLKAGKLAWILRDCGVRFLIARSGSLPDLGGCPELARVLTEAEDLAAFPLARPQSGVTGDDLCALIYTSGSTGTPRGVMLTHRNVAAASASIIEYLENREDDVVVDFLPLSFDYGLYNVLMPFRFGGRVVLERSFLYPYQLIGLLKKERVTGLPIVPTIAAGLVRLRSLEGYDLPDLRYVTSTGQALPPPHIERLREIFPGAKIFSMYGLTECKRVSYLPPAELEGRPASVGKAMPGTEAWLADGAGERIARPDEAGELVVRGPHVMRGYWNLPAETARVLRPGSEPESEPGERVLHTGDLFRMDAAGFLYFVSRRDDLIKTGGERVSPKEIESVVHALDGVAEAAACGVPDELLGQAVHLAVTLRDGAALTAADILAHCARHLEKSMVPRHVEIRGELPRTATGKIARRELGSARL